MKMKRIFKSPKTEPALRGRGQSRSRRRRHSRRRFRRRRSLPPQASPKSRQSCSCRPRARCPRGARSEAPGAPPRNPALPGPCPLPSPPSPPRPPESSPRPAAPTARRPRRRTGPETWGRTGAGRFSYRWSWRSRRVSDGSISWQPPPTPPRSPWSSAGPTGRTAC